MTFTHDSKYEPNDAEARHMSLTGRTVLDNRAERVGKVTDVLFDDESADWVVVKTGLLRGEHFVPLEHTYVDEDGHLVVTLEKAHIKRAPRACREHVITSQSRHQLRDYYGIAA